MKLNNREIMFASKEKRRSKKKCICVGQCEQCSISLFERRRRRRRRTNKIDKFSDTISLFFFYYWNILFFAIFILFSIRWKFIHSAICGRTCQRKLFCKWFLHELEKRQSLNLKRRLMSTTVRSFDRFDSTVDFSLAFFIVSASLSNTFRSFLSCGNNEFMDLWCDFRIHRHFLRIFKPSILCLVLSVRLRSISPLPNDTRTHTEAKYSTENEMEDIKPTKNKTKKKNETKSGHFSLVLCLFVFLRARSRSHLSHRWMSQRPWLPVPVKRQLK